jgi:hypothetical protein
MAAGRIRRIITRIVVGLLLVYGVLLVLIFDAMHQPPDKFGRVMKHVPMPLFLVVPFETMWNKARGGHLAVGETAPDFDLRTADKSSRVRLSSFRGQKPVVLVFGSYT